MAAISLDLETGDKPDEAWLYSPAEEVLGHVTGNDVTSLVWIGQTPNATQMISWGADGSARYSVHLSLGPVLVSYLGSCTAT
ncbi:MAG: hypothetical protein ACPGNV_08265 [Mangrovicoccus sp.]